MTGFRRESGLTSCEEVAEHISALCDGETIPREAAQHLGECEICKARLEDYLRMGVELKRMASAEIPQPQPTKLAPIPWERERRSTFQGWRIWRQTMRIPWVTFALMLVAIAVLSFRIVTVRATGKRWLEVRVWDKNGNPSAKVRGEISPGKNPSPVVAFKVSEGWVGVNVILLGEREGTETLGIRALFMPDDADRGKEGGGAERIRSAPMKQVGCKPGEKVPISVDGYGSIEVSEEVLDKMPEWADPNKQTLYPQKGMLSIKGTLILLREKEELAKTESMGNEFGAKDNYFALRLPNEGRYVFATQPFDGAVESRINFNQVQFALGGKNYVLVAGAPFRSMSDPQQMWVRHDPESELPPASSQTKATVNWGAVSALSKNANR